MPLGASSSGARGVGAGSIGTTELADGAVTPSKQSSSGRKRYFTGVLNYTGLGAGTTYVGLGESIRGAVSPTTTAGEAQIVARNAMTLKGLTLRTFGAVPAAANSIQVVIQVNGADTALDITVSNASAATTTYPDDADVAVAAGERIGIKVVVVGATGTGKNVGYTLEWEPA